MGLRSRSLESANREPNDRTQKPSAERTPGQGIASNGGDCPDKDEDQRPDRRDHHRQHPTSSQSDSATIPKPAYTLNATVKGEGCRGTIHECLNLEPVATIEEKRLDFDPGVAGVLVLLAEHHRSEGLGGGAGVDDVEQPRIRKLDPQRLGELIGPNGPASVVSDSER